MAADSEVGFAELPNQLHRYATERGFQINIMVVGESGLGKSTFVNSLFASDVFTATPYPKPGERIPPTTTVQRSTARIIEQGVRVDLTMVDTPGFGNDIDNTNCWKPILDEIDRSYEAYMNAESKVQREDVEDERVHCCLYFLAPNGHCVKPLDLAMLKLLHNKVNVVPCIAKGDTLTVQEGAHFKEVVQATLKEHNIQIYQFPDTDDDDEEDSIYQDQTQPPFVVCGSVPMAGGDGKVRRVREYPWGQVTVDSSAHSEVNKLRTLVIRTHLQHLIDHTHFHLYEAFRVEKMTAIGISSPSTPLPGDAADDPMAQLAMQKMRHEAKMKKMEQEMSEVFAAKVQEKEAKLKMSEEKLLSQHEEMQRELQAERTKLTRMRAEFEAEKRLADKSLERTSSGASGLGAGKKKKGFF